MIELPSQQKSHRIFLINMFWRWDLTEAYHLLPEAIVRRMVWKPKYLMIGQVHGFKQLTTRLQTEGSYKRSCLRIEAEVSFIYRIKFKNYI